MTSASSSTFSALAQSQRFRWKGRACALALFWDGAGFCLSRRARAPPPFVVAVAAAGPPLPSRGLWLRSLRGAKTEALAKAFFSSSSSSSSSPRSPCPPQQSLTLLVMQPCGGDGDGEAVGAALLQPQVLQPTPGLASEAAAPPSAQSSFMVFCDLVPAAEVEGDGEAGGGGRGSDSPGGGGGGGGGGGLEDLEDEDESGAQSGGGGGGRCKSCTYQGCRETTTQVAKQRKPWMCKRHRNKMYKDKYKRKKSDQALGSGGGGGGGGGGSGGGSVVVPGTASVAPGAAPPAGSGPGSGLRVEDCTEGSISVSKQRTGSIGDRPAKPTLLEQVLNQKRLSLLRSPEVVQFLQKRQQLLSQQAMEQRQQHFSGAPV